MSNEPGDYSQFSFFDPINMGSAPTVYEAGSFGICSEIGGRLVQQDSYLIHQSLFTTSEGKQAHLYAVCDGHGTKLKVKQ